MHKFQKRRRRIWLMESSSIILILLLFLPDEISGAKFYTGNVSSPSEMKEIFIDDWPETRKAPLSKNASIAEINSNKKSYPLLNGIENNNNSLNETLVKSLENIDFSLLCSEGVPLLQEGDQPKKCDPNSIKSDCPNGFWCHIGNTPATFFCCPSNRKIPNLCHLPPNSGFGKDKINRYWYDWRSGFCREMIYSGYGGNENNFVIRDKCEKRCAGTPKPSTTLSPERKPSATTSSKNQKPDSTIRTPPKVFTSTPLVTTTNRPILAATTPMIFRKYPSSTVAPPPSDKSKASEKVTNPCNLSPDKGEKASSATSNERIFRWYFDMVAERCIQFYYLGNKGNSNNFLHEDSCLETCGGGPHEFNSCNFPMEPGFGDYLIPRYYFNEKSKTCRKFTYKGYGGNYNRFASRSTCEQICIKKTIAGHSHARKPLTVKNSLPLTTTTINSPSKITTLASPTATTNHHSSLTSKTTIFPFLHPNPLSLTPDIVQSIFDLNKFTNGPDPFQQILPKDLKPAKPITTSAATTLQPLTLTKTSSSNLSENENEEDTDFDPFEIPENEITEFSPDPFEPKINSSTTNLIRKAKFPLAKFPRNQNSTDYEDEEESTTDSEENDPFTENINPIIIIENNYSLITTTPTNINFPTLVNIIDENDNNNNNNNPNNSIPNLPQPQQLPNGMFVFPTPTSTASPFQHHFKKYSTTPIPIPSTIIDLNNILQNGLQPNGSYQFSNFQNIIKFVNSQNQNHQNHFPNSMSSFPTAATMSTGIPPQNPCLIPAPNNHYLQSCRPENTFPARGAVWSQLCPTGSFCQVGESIQQSVCCPNFGVDACMQIKAPGMGTSSLRRWYFDAIAQQCRGFVYKGYQGNQNNFLTYESCRRKCGAKNPCDYGTPYGFESLEGSQSCSPTSSSTCPPQYYCHVNGDSAATSENVNVCCPMFNGTTTNTNTNFNSTNNENHISPLVGTRQGSRKYIPSSSASSPCSMKISPGTGGMNLNRWAYNPVTKSCMSFVYHGNGGNSNNFLTKSDCINICVATINPCSVGSPLVDENQMLRCSTSSSSSSSSTTCPNGYYCHLGGTQQTNVCCPSTGISPCLLTLSTGSGSSILHRYYFDLLTSSCKAFTYTGMGGNENNFMTVQECRKACPEYDNPCSVGKPHTNPSDGSVSFCTSANPTCPKNYFCHIGDSRPTTVCCPSVGHPCSASIVLGIGNNQLPRYYYNSKTRTCIPFLYSGKGGNANNFISKTECEISCPVLDNPCITGFPSLDSYGEPQFCSTSNQDDCPHGFWCHIGNTQSTTLCCPGAGDPCRLPMSKGTGTSVLNRWYFNTESKVCVSFVYSGRGGNQNNFMSRQECLSSCPEYASPCPEGQPHIGLSGQITHCGATDPSICPTTYWCHVGATLEASVCCPGAADPCDQELSKGVGNAQLLRYHYNQLSRSCNQFRYSGLGGNENNFLTKAACEARCPVFVSPCAAGAPEMDESLMPIACSAADNSTCSPGHWCHIGATEQTTICCSGASLTICEEPRVSGSGEASLPRYYFNPLTKQCLPFIYHGNGGNQNNFLSRASCENTCQTLENPCAAGDPATGSNGLYLTCSSNSPNVCPAGYWCHIGADATEAICCPGAENPCSMPSAAGEGIHSLTRWYFDSNLRRCAKFTYSGLSGNNNNFLTLQECQLKCPEFESPCSTGDPAQAPSGGILFCSATEQTCPSSYWCHIGASSDSTVCCPNAGDPCLSPMQPGIGNAKISRWYFNQNTRQCLQFTYSGTGGNANNFVAENECVARCPVFKNPCPNTFSNNNNNNNQFTIIRCSAQNAQNCPSGFWCHIGATSDTSVCCPGASDPCRLSVSQGIDNNIGPFTRYYFDFTTRLCKPFQYSGYGGNENNFLTKEDCVQRCPEFVNPCFTGEPLISKLTGFVKSCNNRKRSIGCPQNYYCHLGASSDTAACCPNNNRNPCSQALAIGTGSHSIPRWYFNSQSRQCQEFIYSGLTGNANNFVSRAACAQACPEFSNPCGDGQPLTSIGGQVTYCSPQNRFICPSGYFCHVGAAADSTVCCPGPINPCLLSMEVGRGSSSLPRYYFNHFSKQCQHFIYSGSGGNANNFISLEACQQACPEFNNPCSSGGMPFQPNGRATFHCDQSTPCPHDYYCHYGIDSISTVCCPVITHELPCQLPVSVGTGKASLTRYYYNSQFGQCTPFVYSGLGGNQNNFISMHDCINSCGMSSHPFMSTSSCNNNNNGQNCQGQQQQLPQNMIAPLIIRSPFNSRMHKINEKSNFISSVNEAQIPHQTHHQRKVCPQGEPLITMNGEAVTCNIHETNNPCPRDDYVCNINHAGEAFCCPDPKNFCLKPPNPGDCRQIIFPSPSTKFGYNPFTDTCQQFSFIGCGGNLNNFNSLSECSNICCNKGYNLLMKFNDDVEDVDMAAKRWKDSIPIISSSSSFKSMEKEKSDEKEIDDMITEFLDSSREATDSFSRETGDSTEKDFSLPRRHPPPSQQYSLNSYQ